MRLEQENDDLAHELVTSKIALRNDLDQVTGICHGDVSKLQLISASFRSQVMLHNRLWAQVKASIQN